MSLHLFSLNDVKQSIDMNQAIDAMERAFIQLARHQVQLPLRTSIPVNEAHALTLSMPAYLAGEKVLGLKVVSVFPDNVARQKPVINGFIMLLDAETGEPKALMDAGYLTALRTGAISGLATRYFASESATHVAIIGSGVQAETQLQAVAAVRDIKRVSLWSRTSENARQMAKKFEHQYNIEVSDSVAQAVAEADVICTATSSTEPLIHRQDVQKHAHINAIGSHTRVMREIANDLLHEAVVIADQREAVLAESGEIISAVEQGLLKKNAIVELGPFLLQKHDDFKNKLSVFKSVGLAIQDMSVASQVYTNAMKQGLGTAFTLS
ncbi:ornithine cyclodeaminase family protein [Legionella sp. CNM-4043-24]|uniref:ornithine cyclodeaminase family protein n=1 Tax=Legionella sp. CNM-4043-24 TaxID=3421646 RepID=UPI00403AEC1E